MIASESSGSLDAGKAGKGEKLLGRQLSLAIDKVIKRQTATDKGQLTAEKPASKAS